MKKKIKSARLGFAVALCGLSLSAAAYENGAYSPPGHAVRDYSYLEGGVISHDDDRTPRETGGRIAGSFGVLPAMALIGEYAGVDNYDQISAGALFHTPVASNVDLVLGGTVEYQDIGWRDDTGFGVRGGVRVGLLPRNVLELNPELRVVRIFSQTDVSARLAALFNVLPHLDLQAAGQLGDDKRLELGARYNFSGL